MLEDESIDFQFEILFDWWMEAGSKRCSFCRLFHRLLYSGKVQCLACPLYNGDGQCHAAWHAIEKAFLLCRSTASTVIDVKRTFVQVMFENVPRILEAIEAVEATE